MEHRIAFTKGLNRDLSPDKYDSESYWDAYNIQILSDMEGSGYSVQPELSVGSLFRFPAYHELLGWTNMRNYLILFTGIKNSEYLYIWLLEFEGSIDKIKASVTPGDYLQPGETLDVTYHLKYSADLNMRFTSTYEVKLDCTAKYINPTYGKVYWTDFYNPLRSINILDPDVASIDPGLIDIVPHIDLTDIAYDCSYSSKSAVTPGGTIPSGVVQYGYQLFNTTGIYTNISPLTGLLQLTSSDHSVLEQHDYRGDPVTTNSGKKVSLLISNTDNTYEYIRVIGFYYTDSLTVPLIKVLTEMPNPGTGSITIIDDGINYSDTLTLETLVAQINPFTCKTLAIKDKRLCAGNIKETPFNVDYDSRTYRFTKTSSTRLDMRIQNVDGTTIISSSSQPILYSGGAWTYNRTTYYDTINDGSPVPTDHDCYIGHNTLYGAGTINSTTQPLYYYKYMLYDNGDGTFTRRLGGMGKNVDYWFTIDPIAVLDNNSDDGEYNTVKASTNYASSYSYSTRITDTFDDWSNYKSYTHVGAFRGYQRDEIYRWGIVFINGKGQKSYVNWIGDIKMPAIWESDDVETITGIYTFPVTKWNDTYSVVYGMVLSVNFIFRNIPTDPITGQSYKYQVVRVKRGLYDQSIHSQGIIRTLSLDNLVEGSDYYFPTAPSESTSEYGVSTIPDQQYFVKYFASPEICFDNSGLSTNLTSYAIDNQYTAYTNGDTIYGTNNLQRKGIVKDFASELYTFKIRTWDRMYTNSGTFPSTSTAYKVENILGSAITEDRSYTYSTTLNGNLIHGIYNYIRPTYNGMGRIAYIVTDIASGYAADVSGIANLKTENISQYNGFTYEIRQNNEYIACSGILSGSTRKQIFGGDIFIGYFPYLFAVNREYEDAAHANDSAVIFLIPLEARYNLDMMHGDNWPHYTSVNVSVRADTPNAPPEQEYDYYLYNSMYSREEDAIKYYAKPVLFNEQQEIDTQIKVSDQSYGSEIIDNWLNFPLANISEVDTEYGAINKLLTWKDKLYFFQDKGFGIQAINERALMRTETSEELVLGSGDIIGDYGYISTNYGTKYLRSVLGTDTGIYFIDQSSKTIFLYNISQQSPLNKIKGLNSYFNNNLAGDMELGQSDDLTVDISSGFDIENNRAYFTIKNKYSITVSAAGTYFLLYSGYPYRFDLIKVGSVLYYGSTPITITSINDTYSPTRVYFSGATISSAYALLTINIQFTLSYNELIGAFESFHSYSPDFYISQGGKLLHYTRGLESSGPANTRDAYVNNVGLPGSSSYITVISNQYPNKIKTFTNIEYDLYSNYLNQDLYSSNLASIRVYNDYQDTGVISLTSSNSKRRMRIWRYIIPRSIKISATDRNDARIRDYHIKIKFTFSNKIQKLRNILVKYLANL